MFCCWAEVVSSSLYSIWPKRSTLSISDIKRFSYTYKTCIKTSLSSSSSSVFSVSFSSKLSSSYFILEYCCFLILSLFVSFTFCLFVLCHLFGFLCLPVVCLVFFLLIFPFLNWLDWVCCVCKLRFVLSFNAFFCRACNYRNDYRIDWKAL